MRFLLSLVAALSILALVPCIGSADEIHAVRIYSYIKPVYYRVRDNCVGSLEERIQDAGYKVEITKNYQEFSSRTDGTVGIILSFNQSHIGSTSSSSLGNFMLSLGDAPETKLSGMGSVFVNPTHFARFITSLPYQQAISANLADKSEESRDFRGLVSQSYGGTEQLFTSDKPIVVPGDLRGRRILDLYGSWYSSISEFLGISHTEIFDPYSDGEETFDFARNQVNFEYKPDDIVLLPVTSANILSKEQRKYLSLTMTETHVVDFRIFHWPDLDPTTQASFQKIISEAARMCSARNYDSEKSAIDQLKKDGTVIVPADLKQFLPLVRVAEKTELAEARKDNSPQEIKDYEELIKNTDLIETMR